MAHNVRVVDGAGAARAPPRGGGTGRGGDGGADGRPGESGSGSEGTGAGPAGVARLAVVVVVEDALAAGRAGAGAVVVVDEEAVVVVVSRDGTGFAAEVSGGGAVAVRTASKGWTASMPPPAGAEPWAWATRAVPGSEGGPGDPAPARGCAE